MIRWFASGIILIFALAVMGCGPDAAPAPQATAAPEVTSPEATAPDAPTPRTSPAGPAPTPLDPAPAAGAQTGDTVSVHYTGRLENGTVFDSSEGKDPLEFTLGQGQVIPGFERGVLGMAPGHSKTLQIPAEDAYGPRQPELVFEVDRDELPAELELEVGMQIQGGQPDGGIARYTVVDITDTTVSLDANHFLAGQDLIFDIEVVGIN